MIQTIHPKILLEKKELPDIRILGAWHLRAMVRHLRVNKRNARRSRTHGETGTCFLIHDGSSFWTNGSLLSATTPENQRVHSEKKTKTPMRNHRTVHTGIGEGGGTYKMVLKPPTCVETLLLKKSPSARR